MQLSTSTGSHGAIERGVSLARLVHVPAISRVPLQRSHGFERVARKGARDAIDATGAIVVLSQRTRDAAESLGYLSQSRSMCLL